MKKNILLASLSLILLTYFCGCASVDSLDKTREEFPHRVKSSVYAASYNDVYNAVKKTCQEMGIKIYSEDKELGRIYGQSSPRWGSVLLTGIFGYGEKVGIYIIDIDEKYTIVDIVVQKSTVTDVGHVDWREKILKKIGENLKQ